MLVDLTRKARWKVICLEVSETIDEGILLAWAVSHGLILRKPLPQTKAEAPEGFTPWCGIEAKKGTLEPPRQGLPRLGGSIPCPATPGLSFLRTGGVG